MVVGEPSLMGGEFGDEDERLITRLENAQNDPSVPGGPATSAPGASAPASAGGAPLLEENNYTSSPLTSGGSWTSASGERPLVIAPQASTPNSQDSDKKSPAVGQ